jgi:CBS-domain-containing membrane protein
MTTEVVTVGPETEVSEVARLLLARRISAVPVVEEGGRVVGMVGEGDLMRRAECGRKWWLSLLADRTAEFVRTHGTRARDVMTPNVVSIGKDATLAEIARTLERHGIKRVPVIEDGRLAGIVSRSDVLRGLATLTRTGNSASVGPDDRLLQQSILDLVRRNTTVSLRAVSIIVVAGRVYLWGVTDTSEEREAVRIAAETIAGRDNVHDYLNTLSQVLQGL